MANPYDGTFTLSDGATTITWNARPSSVQYPPNLLIGTHHIPGQNQSAQQNFGTGGILIKFSGTIYNITAVSMTGAPTNAEDIMAQIRDWAIDGEVLEFTSDHILEINSGSALDVKINEFDYVENSGHAHDYNFDMTLLQYNSGSAFN